MKEKDLCSNCEHEYLDFPLPLDCYVSYCEIFKSDKPLNEVVPYPCIKCPCNSYKAKLK